MSRTVNNLGVPPMDLTITDAGNGKLKVELQVPRSSGSLDNIPFLEVTRNEQQTLLNGARQDIIARLSQSGFQIGEVKYEAGTSQNVGGNVGGNAQVPKLGKVSFEITADREVQGNISGSIRNNPDVAGAIREAERNFDTRRQDIYESRAREWHRNGGATLVSNGETYRVTEDAAKNYINQRHPLNPFKRVSADEEGAPVLVAGNTNLNRQFGQLLQSAEALNAPNPRAPAAVALETLTASKSYKPGETVALTPGGNGNFVVTQGTGDSALNLPVPQAKQGDLDRVATQLAQQPQTTQQNNPVVAMEQPQQERRSPVV